MKNQPWKSPEAVAARATRRAQRAQALAPVGVAQPRYLRKDEAKHLIEQVLPGLRELKARMRGGVVPVQSASTFGAGRNGVRLVAQLLTSGAMRLTPSAKAAGYRALALVEAIEQALA
jgi:hypothetical protein